MARRVPLVERSCQLRQRTARNVVRGAVRSAAALVSSGAPSLACRASLALRLSPLLWRRAWKLGRCTGNGLCSALPWHCPAAGLHRISLDVDISPYRLAKPLRLLSRSALPRYAFCACCFTKPALPRRHCTLDGPGCEPDPRWRVRGRCACELRAIELTHRSGRKRSSASRRPRRRMR